MDKPSLKSLNELTGDGEQTVIAAGASSGTVDWYRVDFILDTTFSTIEIQGQDQSLAFGANVMKAGNSLYNVTNVEVATGLLIGFTAPELT